MRQPSKILRTNQHSFRFRYRRIFISLSILLVLYLGVTYSAYWYVYHHRNLTQIAYLDIALPSRWPQYQVKRGDHHIQSALTAIKNGKIDDGFYQLRVGLARSPANQQGRLALAQLYADSKRADLCQTILLDGLEYHKSDPKYVLTVLRFLLSKSEDRLAVTICDRIISDQVDNKSLIEIVTYYAATACFNRGNYDRAEKYLIDQQLSETKEGRMLTARLEWERGHHDLALIILQDLNQKFPTSEDIYAKFIEYLWALDRVEEARRAIVIHQIAHPDRPRSHIDQLYALLREGDPKALTKATEGVLINFKDDPDSLLSLGDFAATNGQVELAREIRAIFSDHQWSGETAIQLMEIEALIAAKQYATALSGIQDLLNTPELELKFLNIGQGLQAIAQYGVGDPVAAYVSLTALLALPNLHPESLLAIANRLLAMGKLNPAREVLEKAVTMDSKNQAALTQLVEFDLKARDITAMVKNLQILVKMRKPSHELMRRIETLLKGDNYLFLPDRTKLLQSMELSVSNHVEFGQN